MSHIKYLDTVRALAVLLVIISHWLPIGFLHTSGFVGVNIFFVLSGFLITRILFDNKNEAEAHSISKLEVFKNFFFRRALRILPIYYLLLLILYLTQRKADPTFESELVYLSSFSVNFRFYDLKYFSSLTSHFWSLAVEEQFYLFWPWVILLARKRFLPYIILGFILIGTVSQLFITDHKFGYLPTYTCFDSFGMGALLAWVLVYRPEALGRLYKSLHILVGLSVVLLACRLSVFPQLVLPFRTLTSLMALWLITYLVYKGQTDQVKLAGVFNNKALLAMGKVSYGLYLYHIPSPYLAWAITSFLASYYPPLTDFYVFFAALNVGLLWFLAWFSWRFVEKPFLQLKKHFVYKKDPLAAPAQAAVPMN